MTYRHSEHIRSSSESESTSGISSSDESLSDTSSTGSSDSRSGMFCHFLASCYGRMYFINRG